MSYERGEKKSLERTPTRIACMFIPHSGPQTEPTILLLPMTVKCTLLVMMLLQHEIENPIRYL